MVAIDKPIALVVGAGDHLGSAIARRFAREGYHLVVNRRRGDLNTLCDEIRALGSSATAVHSDARDEAQVTDLVNHVETRLGPIRVAIFNVGGNVRYTIGETTTRVYRKVWEMCALAGFLVGREVADKMLARNEATLGIGAGQMSRIDASELAVRKATKSELDLKGSVVASDAFFPFRDGIDQASEAGIRSVIQPGGSIRDDEVIEAVDEHDMSMVFTGERVFKH